MNWADKYRQYKDQTKLDGEKKAFPPETLFKRYQEELDKLFSLFSDKVKGTMIQAKHHKILLSKDPIESSVMSEREKIDSLVLSDNNNELKLMPEGIHFIGVLGRVSIRSYKKVYSFNSIIEKRLKTIKEPYFFLIQDLKDTDKLNWGYIKEEENAFFGHEVVRITEDIVEQILDETFIYT